MMMAAKGKADGTVMDRSDGPCLARWINGSKGMVTASRLLGASRHSSSSIRQQVQGTRSHLFPGLWKTLQTPPEPSAPKEHPF